VIENKAKGKTVPDFKIESTTLKENRGAFVTIHKKGQLRGCIGNMIGNAPLVETIQEMAIASSTQDPRFHQLRPEELAEIDCIT
jgi:AMMECR1 domain-containing protein